MSGICCQCQPFTFVPSFPRSSTCGESRREHPTSVSFCRRYLPLSTSLAPFSHQLCCMHLNEESDEIFLTTCFTDMGNTGGKGKGKGKGKGGGKKFNHNNGKRQRNEAGKGGKGGRGRDEAKKRSAEDAGFVNSDDECDLDAMQVRGTSCVHQTGPRTVDDSVFSTVSRCFRFANTH